MPGRKKPTAVATGASAVFVSDPVPQIVSRQSGLLIGIGFSELEIHEDPPPARLCFSGHRFH